MDCQKARCQCLVVNRIVADIREAENKVEWDINSYFKEFGFYSEKNGELLEVFYQRGNMKD